MARNLTNKPYKPSSSFRAVSSSGTASYELPKIPEMDEVKRLVDNIMVNDLQEEYYYKAPDVVKEAVDAHLQLLELDPDLYKELIRLTLDISLNGQKALAAMYLYDRLPSTKDNDNIIMDIVRTLPPRWRMLWL